jgi:hypothetical protein
VNAAQKAAHRDRNGRSPATCYHEAGHCLVRWYFGHPFDRVLVLTADEIRRGVQPVNRHGVAVSGVRGIVEGNDRVSRAPVPRMLDHMGWDSEHLAQLRHAKMIRAGQELIDCQAGMAAEARFRKCSITAAMLTGGASDRARAQGVLDTWFPDATAREQAAILAERSAITLIRSQPGWAAITAIASALLEHGELSWEQANPLCATAYGHEQPDADGWLNAWPPSLEMIRAGQVPGVTTGSSPRTVARACA